MVGLIGGDLPTPKNISKVMEVIGTNPQNNAAGGDHGGIGAGARPGPIVVMRGIL